MTANRLGKSSPRDIRTNNRSRYAYRCVECGAVLRGGGFAHDRYHCGQVCQEIDLWDEAIQEAAE